MKQSNIEDIVRATIEQLTKQKPAEDSDDYQRFVEREERKKMKRFQNKINKA